MVPGTSLGAFVVACLCASMTSAQDADIKWTRNLKFSVSDRREVVALAKLMGVEDPESVDANLRDDCCRIVSVIGRVVENGPERRWPRASMIRDNWREYADEPPPKDRLRVGHWIADGPPTVFAEWRVRDGAWFVDVGYGINRPSVSYPEAELIVLALHHGTVVNKLQETTLKGVRTQPSVPTLEGGVRYGLSREPSRAGPSIYEYEISIWTGRDGGIVLRMRIVDETVEAVSLGVFEV